MNTVTFRFKVLEGEKYMDRLLKNHEILTDLFGRHKKNVRNDEQFDVTDYVLEKLEQDFGYQPEPNVHASKVKWLKTEWYTYCRVTLRIEQYQWYELIYNFYDELDAIQFRLMTS